MIARAGTLSQVHHSAIAGATHPLVLITAPLEPLTRSHLEPLFKAIDLCDHAIGRRPASSTDRGFFDWIGSLPRRLIFAVPILDVDSPLSLHRTETLTGHSRFNRSSSFVNLEILAKGTFFGHLLSEVDVPRSRGWTTRKGWWTDLCDDSQEPGVSDRLSMPLPSVPAKDSQSQVEGPEGPGGEDHDGLEHVVLEEPGAVQKHQAKAVDELGQGECLDERLGGLAEVLGGEEDAGEQVHRQHDQVHEPADGLGGVRPAGDQESNAGEGQCADDVDQEKDQKLPRIGI